MNKQNLKQHGFSLFIVMILMIVIAFLVIVTNQASLTEMRMSSNEADRKLALSRAENGLRAAEVHIEERITGVTTDTEFTANCQGGYCLPAAGTYNAANAKSPFRFSTTNTSSIEAWKRCRNNLTESCEGKPSLTILDNPDTTLEANDNTTYIIEYLGYTENSSSRVQEEIFRITAKARGNNENTQVILQSYVGLTRDE